MASGNSSKIALVLAIFSHLHINVRWLKNGGVGIKYEGHRLRMKCLVVQNNKRIFPVAFRWAALSAHWDNCYVMLVLSEKNNKAIVHDLQPVCQYTHVCMDKDWICDKVIYYQSNISKKK